MAAVDNILYGLYIITKCYILQLGHTTQKLFSVEIYNYTTLYYHITLNSTL